MVKVTDKDYYLDGYLKSNLDFLIKRHLKSWDNVVLTDGDERAGKSTLTKAMAYYVAYTMGREFTADDIFFDCDKMITAAMNSRGRIFVWDEAALSGMAEDWQQNIQKKLIKMLITCGKYGHLFFFVIPKFHQLRYYLAISRSIALIRVYSPDRLQRGYFYCYAKDAKQRLYWIEKNDQLMNARKMIPSFKGRFSDVTGKLIDEDIYEKNKDAAIQSIDEEKESRAENLWKTRFLKIMPLLKKHGYSQEQVAANVDMQRQNLNAEVSKFRAQQNIE